MCISRNFISSIVVLMSSSVMVACNQSGSEQPGSGEPGNINTSQSTPVATQTTPTATQSTPTIVSGKTTPSVALSSTDVNVYLNDTFTLDITTSEFTTSEGGGITLRFNPALLQVTSVDIDSTTWNFVNKNGAINNSEGRVSDILFSSYQGVVGDSKIATVTFKSIGRGTSTITLEASSSNPFASNGEEIDVSFITTNVSSN